MPGADWRVVRAAAHENGWELLASDTGEHGMLLAYRRAGRRLRVRFARPQHGRGIAFQHARYQEGPGTPWVTLAHLANVFAVLTLDPRGDTRRIALTELECRAIVEVLEALIAAGGGNGDDATGLSEHELHRLLRKIRPERAPTTSGTTAS